MEVVEPVRPGTDANELEATAAGERLNLRVNGAEVAAVSDPMLRAGRVGVWVGGDGNEVRLERLVVRVRQAEAVSAC